VLEASRFCAQKRSLNVPQVTIPALSISLVGFAGAAPYIPNGQPEEILADHFFGEKSWTKRRNRSNCLVRGTRQAFRTPKAILKTKHKESLT
jgi:hypothetical protein